MIRLKDIILLAVIYSSMIVGILLPHLGSLLQPYPLYFMMCLLFLSFLSINTRDIWHAVRVHGKTVLWLSVIKLLLIPVIVYLIFSQIFPAYAVAALLLTGISTGVIAPFMSSIIQANGPLVLVMVVVTSPLVPFTLPALVQLLVGRTIELPLLAMIRLLCLVVFAPILAVETLRHFVPKLLAPINNHRFSLSLILIAAVNLGVFSKYAPFFRQNPATLLEATGVAILLGVFYVVSGILALCKAPVENQLASAISLAHLNNVLVIVFASEFFGPLEPTLAAMYMIPFFGLILPLRIYRRLHGG